MPSHAATPAAPVAERRPATELVITGLSVSFGGVHALRDVDLSIAAGELVGLIGPNGAGKSTFVDAVTGYVRPTSGQVTFGGRAATRWSPSRLAHAGLVRTFQHLELFDDLTVWENIAIAARSSRRGSAATAARALDLCKLGDIRDHLVTQVPAGRRRLVGLARALAAAPALLLADEPAAGLDSHESAEFGTVLRRLVDEGLGILLIDHDMNLVLSVCDRLAVLVSGAKLTEGTPAEVRTNKAVIAAYLGGAAS
jgi:ABC-type branched-subunit amino acid transport system ATPase component